MESERSVSQEGYDRLKKIIEDAGISTDGPPPPHDDLVNFFRDNAKSLVELAVWRLEQEDMVGRRLGHDEIMNLVEVLDALIRESEKVAVERKA